MLQFFSLCNLLGQLRPLSVFKKCNFVENFVGNLRKIWILELDGHTTPLEDLKSEEGLSGLQ